jgi:ABC-type protease/lipase transport system fused ATPase/permease subunit
MADFTASQCARNSSVAATFVGLQASQTVDLSSIADEKVVLAIQNTNDSVAVNTATITIAPGGFLSNVLGTLSVDVADANALAFIGPLEGTRFKTTGSKITVGVSVTQSGTVSSVKMAVVKLP